MIAERWLPVLDWKTHYEVSDRGRVRRIAKGQGAVYGRIFANHLDDWGYPRVILSDAPRRVMPRVHQLVARAFLGECPVGHQHNHRDGDKTNNHIENLEYVTPAANVHHAWRNGLCTPNRGEKHGMSKLRDQDVRDIREFVAAGQSHYAIAVQFGVTRPLIGMIANRKIWRHLK